jgi:hypothetical protein
MMLHILFTLFSTLCQIIPLAGPTMVYGGGTVSTPVDSPGTGTYSSAQTITITSTNSTSIYYTVDGSTPACPSTGTLYSGGFTSPSSTFTLKAIGCRTGWTSSGIDTSNYTISGGGGTFVQACSNYNPTSPSSLGCTFGSPITAGHLLVFTVACYGGGATPTWSGDSGVFVQDGTGSFSSSSAFYAHVLSAVGGGTTITETASCGYPAISGAEFTAVSAFDTGDFSANGTGTSIASNTTAGTIGDLLIGFAATYTSSPNPTVGSGWTLASGSSIQGQAMEYKTQSAASPSATFTNGGSSAWGAGIWAFKP